MSKSRHFKILWAIPISLYALDAQAWGLYTHIYFSQYLLICAPLMDQRIRQAIQKFPHLVQAGACLPDLAVISKSFSTSHQWHISEQMMDTADSEEDLAIAVGYASHLFVDVIAHNHFVPAHEAKWMHQTIATHIASEWAMDGHVVKQINKTPYQLISANLEVLSRFAAQKFGVHQDIAKTQLTRLSWLDRMLRASKISEFLLWLLKIRDVELMKNLNYYLNKTEHALNHFHFTLGGQRPLWEPELKNLNAAELIDWRSRCLGDLRMQAHTPVDIFSPRATNNFI